LQETNKRLKAKLVEVVKAIEEKPPQSVNEQYLQQRFDDLIKQNKTLSDMIAKRDK